MKFCTECGHKLPTEQAAFCPSCGHKLQPTASTASQPEPARTESPSVSPVPVVHQEVPERPNVAAEAAAPAKKKIKPVWYVVGVILLVVISGMIYGVYEKSFYPKSETELNPLLLNKYWKTTKVTVREIYVDGRLIQKSNSNPLRTVVNAFEGNTDVETFKAIESSITETSAKENFMVLKKQADGKIFQFDMTYSRSQNEFVFEIKNPTLTYNSKDVEYILNYSEREIPTYSMQSGWLVDDGAGFQIKDYRCSIQKITDQVLEYTSDWKASVDGKEIRLIVAYECAPYIPNNDYIKRVEGQLSIADLPIED